MYGFHKIPHLQQGVLKSDTDTEFWNFEHPNFHRGQPDLLCLVTRKNSKGGSQQNPDLADGDVPISSQTGGGGTQLLDVNSIVSGITAIKRHQQTISVDLNELKTSNQHLWQEALSARERYKSQQDTINRILKFLASVFGRATGHDGKDVDAHSASTPLVRRNQRLLIGNGLENNKHKGVEVVEVEDDDNKSTAETLPTDDQPETPRKCFLFFFHTRPHLSAISPFCSD
jgi:HSF-type DNA-binding